jgi:probable F420-dependent oxidoreductase
VRPFRFGYQVRDGTPDELRSQARAAEDAGFDVVHTYDHVGDAWSPLAPLHCMAEATTRLRVCPLVLNNDFHHPVHLAREVAAIDRLTDGRVELGIGAGHSFPEYEAIGVPFDPPTVRKARLAEAVVVLRRLLDGEEVTVDGDHYRLAAARTMRAQQDRLPILVAVNGRAALAHAAAHADIIGFAGLGRTLADGQRHEVRWQPERLDAAVAHVASSVRAAGRAEPPELNALVQAVTLTDDRRSAAEDLAAEVEGLSASDALATPYLALGTHDEMAAHLLACRARWGISYYSVRDVETFAPVIERLRAADADARP